MDTGPEEKQLRIHMYIYVCKYVCMYESICEQEVYAMQELQKNTRSPHIVIPSETKVTQTYIQTHI